MHRHRRQSVGGEEERGAISLAFPPNDLCDDYFTTSVLSAYFFITARRRGGTVPIPIPVFKFTPSRFPIAIKYSRRRARPSPSIDGAASSPCTTFHTCVGCGSGMARRELIKFPLVSASSPRAFDSSITTAIKTSHPPAPEDLHPKCPPPPGSLSTPTGDSDDLRLPLSLIGDSERHISTLHLILLVAVVLPPICILTTHARAGTPRRSHAARQSVRALCGLPRRKEEPVPSLPSSALLFSPNPPETVTAGWMGGCMASRAVFSHLNGPAGSLRTRICLESLAQHLPAHHPPRNR